METLDFSESFEACDLSIGRYRQHIEFMKLYVIQGQDHFLTLSEGHLHIRIKISQKLLGQPKPKHLIGG